MALQTFRVTASDREGREYVYQVPAESEAMAVAAVYREHGRMWRTGVVPLKLMIWYVVEEV